MKLMILDGNSIINRAFYGVGYLSAQSGQPTGAIYGFLNIMQSLLDEEKPEALAVAFDEKGPTFRHNAYETIVRFLTQEGLVSGVRGKGGGYRLTRKPEDYTAAEILKVAELSLSPVACLEKGAAPCPRADRCRTLPLWKGLDQVVDDYLSHYTLRDLMDQAHQAQEAGE